MAKNSEHWPALPLEDWQPTYQTLQLWTQIVGKIRLAQTPWINHSWHVTLYVTTRGLTTSPIPHGQRSFQIDFDLVDHRLLIQTDAGEARVLKLRPQAVADFYHELLNALRDLDFPVSIYPKPNEVEHPVPFDQDFQHASYDPVYANRFFQALLESQRVMCEFRARFLGKCSPVHFFWGSFDLAVTRFSGHLAPTHPGGVLNLPDWVVREAYSQEVSSCGFWPGGGPHPFPLYYSYAYPEPKGFKTTPVRPQGAFYSEALHEFILPYEEVRSADDPDAVLLDFFQSTYEAAASLGNWDRQHLERTKDPRPTALTLA